MSQLGPPTHVIRFQPRRRRLAGLGEWMVSHRRAILATQWVVIVVYAALVVIPACLPEPSPSARLLAHDTVWHDRLVLFAQYAFWGVWWPFVILSTMLFGRIWCGVFCPEGALSEFASRHGRGGAIPRWLRWEGWPAAAFVATTLYGQLISVYDYPKAALLILGGSTVAAMIVGYLYGRGKRVWCRYLCPVSGIFSLLARIAPVHFEVDRTRWDAFPGRPPAVDCAPLLDIKHMQGASQCHACGRCAGHRDAVQLATRSPTAEILERRGAAPGRAEVLLLVFGMIGVAVGAFQWTINPWLTRATQYAATWLVEHDVLWPLDTNAPWWLLTHQETTNDVFSWLDGAMIVAYVSMSALLLGGICWVAITAAARVTRVDRYWLAMSLVPIAGVGLFLGLSMMTMNHVRAEGIHIPYLGVARGTLIAAGALGSAWLGVRQLKDASQNAMRRVGACALFCMVPGLLATVWIRMLIGR